MARTDIEHLIEVLQSFDTAMLVTHRDNELRSRPMAIADHAVDGRIWFITSIDSGKIEEITESPNVNVAMQAASRFLSISGTTKVSRDRDRLASLWSLADNAWFPEGKDDPTAVVLEVVPTYAEYWDRSGLESARILFELGKSALSGEKPQLDDGAQQKIEFPESLETPR